MAIQIKITKYSHFFKCEDIHHLVLPLIYKFSKKFIKVDTSRPPPKRGEPIEATVYCTSRADRSEFRFHINALARFIDFLKIEHVRDDQIELHQAPAFESDKIHAMVGINPKTGEQWELRKEQPAVVEYLRQPGHPVAKFVGIQTGEGKAQPLDSLVKIPGGWKQMGRMQVGDLVTAHDGTPVSVTAIHPQGVTDVYTVTFYDGRTVECSPEHLWKVYYVNTSKHKRWRVVDTMEMKRLISLPNPRVYVPLCESEESEDIHLPIDPYVLGLLLGNGCLGYGPLSHGVGYTSIDYDTVAVINDHLKDFNAILVSAGPRDVIQYRLKKIDPTQPNQFVQVLKDLNLLGTRALTKSIPNDYLYGSTQQRLALVQGLLDSDGTVNKNTGTPSYSTSSEDLAFGFQYLVRSLGGIATKGIKHPHYTHNGEKLKGAVNYVINVRYKKPSDLFRIERKRILTNDNNQYAEDLKLLVRSVELTRKTQTQCITIDHPEHLYVTNNFVVTHNSFTSTYAMLEYDSRSAIVVKASFMEKWVDDIVKYSDIPKKEIMLVKGNKELKKFQELCMIAGALDDVKMVIFSNGTLRNWFDEYKKFGEDSLALGHSFFPEDLFRMARINMRLIDEVHMEFHCNFLIDLYTHVGRSISLSATLLSNDPKTEEMYRLMHPPADRFQGGGLNKYTQAYGVLYTMAQGRNYRTSEFGKTTYSHIALEKSILRNPDMFRNYAEMIKNVLEMGYFKDYRKGDKAVVFAGSKDMCGRLVQYFQRLYPQLDIRRYVDEDPYSNLIEPDLRFTTVLSAGTAHDIPMLTCAFLTIAIQSIQANIQIFGRLRQLIDRITRFYFLSCLDIPKHMKYYKEKEDLMLERATNYSVIPYHFVV